MKITRKKCLIFFIEIVIILVGIGGSVIAGKNNVLPATIANKIQNSVANLISKAKPGTIMHLHHDVYGRHGSVHSKIMEMDWSVPEETVGDIWVGPIDSDGFFISFKSILKDVDGNVVQETNASGSEKVHRDIRTGKEIKSTWEPMSAAGFMDFTGNMASKLLQEGWSLSSTGQMDGEETVIFEKTMVLTPSNDDGSTVIDIPYTMDLNPVAFLLRLEIRLDNPLLQTSQRWAIDDKGARTLVWQDRWTQIAVSY